ncbi:hypothetical protein CP533_1620 [Ophiocordyceps camponoti-saundersi (nom. inval.)]|nr:hypothetical protein CP533_1620 [Ophiocordyceps camponoti-saundersi (nom. inval.)]
MRTSAVLLLASVLAEQASADVVTKVRTTAENVAQHFNPTPAHEMNVCSPEKQRWMQFPSYQPGQAVTECENVKFLNFYAGENPNAQSGSRLGRRTFLLNYLLAYANSKRHGQAPSIIKGDNGDGTYIKELDILCDSAGVLGLQFVMPGGAKCRMESQCESQQFIFKNTECTGAVGVSFQWNRRYKLPSERWFGFKGNSAWFNAILDKLRPGYFMLYRIHWDCQVGQVSTIQGTHQGQRPVSPHQVVTDANGGASFKPQGQLIDKTISGEKRVLKGEDTTEIKDEKKDVKRPVVTEEIIEEYTIPKGQATIETEGEKKDVKRPTVTEEIIEEYTIPKGQATIETKGKESVEGQAIDKTISGEYVVPYGEATIETKVEESIVPQDQVITEKNKEFKVPEDQVITEKNKEFIVPQDQVITEKNKESVVPQDQVITETNKEFIVPEDQVVTDTTTNSGATTGNVFYPPMLPSCIDTCVGELKFECLDKRDADCFCPNKQFPQKVYSCLNARQGNDDDFAQAKEAFTGMCRSYIPTNPGIVTDADSYLESMSVVPTPHFAPTDYTTMVVPSTQVADEGTTVTVSLTVSVPTVLPTIVPVPAQTGDQPGEGSPKPKDGLQSEPKGKKPQPAAEEYKPEAGLQDNKPQSGPGEYKPQSGPDKTKPQSAPGEIKPQPSCQKPACAGKVEEPSPNNPYEPKTPESQQLAPSPSKPQLSDAAADEENLVSSPESEETGPGPRKTIIKLAGKSRKQRAACKTGNKGPKHSSPEIPQAKDKSPKPDYDSAEVPQPQEKALKPDYDSPKVSQPKGKPSKPEEYGSPNVPSAGGVAPSRPSAGKPYSPEPAESRSGLLGGPESPFTPDYSDEEDSFNIPKSNKPVTQPGAKDKVLEPSKSLSNYNGTATKSAFGGFALQTGAYGKPRYGNETVSGASRASFGLFAVVAAAVVAY